MRRPDDSRRRPRTPIFKDQGEKRNPHGKQRANMEENEERLLLEYGKLQWNGEGRNQIIMD